MEPPVAQVLACIPFQPACSVKMAKQAALDLRVSTGEQTTDNQRQALEAMAAQRGWEVAHVYEDAGISGARGRDKRPGFDAMMRDAIRGRFDILLTWSIDRLGRSLSDLLLNLRELEAARVDLALHQQSIDTTTPAGRALFQMLGVFAEFERAMIVDRVRAGFARVKATGRTKTGRPVGRPKASVNTEKAIRERLLAGMGMTRIARELHCGVGVVMRVKQEMVA